MTQTQKKPINPFSQTQNQNPKTESSSSSSSRNGMKLIVPLQSVVQGRNGFLLGSLIPCALFYFLQLYLKRRRSNSNSNSNPSSPSSSSPTLVLPRSSSRSNLSSRGSISRVRVSKLASILSKPDDSLYYIGLDRVLQDPYDVFLNPNGIIQLGLSDNKVKILSFLFSDTTMFMLFFCLFLFWVCLFFDFYYLLILGFLFCCVVVFGFD
jgi:aminotransferase